VTGARRARGVDTRRARIPLVDDDGAPLEGIALVAFPPRGRRILVDAPRRQQAVDDIQFVLALFGRFDIRGREQWLVLHDPLLCTIAPGDLYRLGNGERASHGEDHFAALPRLYGPRVEASSLPHDVDVVENGDVRVSAQYEVAVHTVRDKGRRHRELRREKRLRDDAAAVDATGPDRLP